MRGNSSVVERHLAKVDVAGPTPVSRSIKDEAIRASGSPFLLAPQDCGPSSRRREEPSVIERKNIEKSDHSSVRLSITVPSAETRKEYDAMIREYSKNVRIDGFRAGHVPATVLERKFGDSLRLDAMGRVLEKAVEEALKDLDPKEQPLAYSTPSLEGEPDFSFDTEFSFTVKYDVFPTIEVGDWKGIEIAKSVVEIARMPAVRRVREELGLAPRVGLSEAIRRTLAWHGGLPEAQEAP